MRELKFKFEKTTSANFKPVGVPRTQLEKYEKLKKNNPMIDKLRAAFDLDLNL